ELRRARWSASSDQLLVAPYDSVRDDGEARLLLVNRFAEPLRYDARAISMSGQSYPLGADEIQPRGIVAIDLEELLSSAGSPFQEGSIQVTYFGDAEMVQAWILFSGPAGSLEQPLDKPLVSG